MPAEPTNLLWRFARSAVVMSTLSLALVACRSGEVQEAGAQSSATDSAGGVLAERGTDARAAEARPRYIHGSTAAEAQQCMSTLQERIRSGAEAERADSTARRPRAGHSAAFAERKGWYPSMPEFRDGSLLPCNRIVAYYGNPLSTRMGILGEIPPDQMLARLDKQVEEWRTADPGTPVIPALHLVTIVAQGSPMRDGKYRLKMSDSLIETVSQWAERRNAIVFLDIQVGLSTVQQEIPRLAEFLKRPNVHLGLDPEFSMKDGTVPGRKIGTMDASDINWAINYLADLVNEHGLPPKVLVVHRFTRPMITNYRNIRLRPEVQTVIHMDGFGAPWLKFDSYRDYVVDEPVQFTGWKNFYYNDTKKGDPLVSPQQLLQLHPVPVYIQYQ